ncbi:MAG: PhoH family protein [Zoogloeaceae bacterium]|nr:PhoH family protein [Zoogloeaceae bacterium]
MPNSAQRQQNLKFSPVDNARLARLCGPLDENLRQIETALDVLISRRGEHFAVKGRAAAEAAAALEMFYRQTIDNLSVDAIQLGLIELRNAPLRRARTPESTTARVAAADSGSTAAAACTLGGPQLLTRKAELHGRTPRQVEYLKHIQAHDITFGIGPAGTGKTYLAVASAVDALERDLVERIILTRPAVEAGERLGFLPGDLAQKVDPYLRPLYDALYDLMGFERVIRLYEKGVLEIAPLAFMRGRTLNHAFIILDEAQNTTPEQMKMFLTRIGIGARAVVTGDPSQADLPKGQKSGLAEAAEILGDVRGIAFVRFLKEDVVRHPLVARIVAAYEQQEKACVA